jgi:transposase
MRAALTQKYSSAFVKKRLVHHLKPGDIVLWNNARFHQGDEVKELIEKLGARIKRLPRYKSGL